jgi:epoxyqueuosine reductase
MGTRIHGCDECQLVCPRNRNILAKADRTDKFLEYIADNFDLGKIVLMDDEYYKDVINR